MQLLRSILRDFRTYFNPTTRWGIIRIVIIVAALIGITIFLTRSDEMAPEATEQLRVVTVTQAGRFNNDAGLSLVGTVEAVDQAAIKSEVGGRVTSVSAKLGDRVGAGEVIATLENASERAAVLQAEGSYEAALASAAQSDVSATDAEESLRSSLRSGVITYRNAYTTVDDIIHNLVDDLFTNPEGATPGFRLDALGQAPSLNQARSEFTAELNEWNETIFANPAEDQAPALLADARSDVTEAIELVDAIAGLLSHEDNRDAVVNGVTVSEYQTSFLTARSSLNTALQNIENAVADITNAEGALERAELQSTNGTVSASDAAVKQALGALRAAQANLEKTIIRAPISGAINVLTVKNGNFIAPNTDVALIANNTALQLTTFVSEADRERIAVGDTVGIDGTASGTIVRIAPAIDPNTGKIEVEIGVSSESDLQNGDTVSVDIQNGAETETAGGPIVVPFSALKITPDGPVAFSVDDGGTLVSIPVELGEITGDRVAVVNGLTEQSLIVTDARGLKEGQAVSVDGE